MSDLDLDFDELSASANRDSDAKRTFDGVQLTSVLPGDPALVESGADLLVTQANQIQKAADDLRNLTFNSTAKALNSVTAKTAETAANLDAAETRYRGTGESLRTYAVELKAAHQRANEAAGSQAAQGRAAAGHETSVRNLEQRARLLEANGAPALSIYQAEQQLAEARYLLRSAEHGAAQAHAAVEQARRDMNAAAERAAARIKGVLAATDPSDTSFMDHGPDAETVVKITKVVDPDGTVRWRVALPSTQEWLT